MDHWALSLAAAFGVLAQVIISPLHEPSTVKILLIYALGTIVLSLRLFFTTLSLSSTTSHIFFLNTSFFSTFILLTLIRRVYFSPLSRFPGPKIAACTKLWLANEFHHGRTSDTVRELHKMHGDIVRVAPAEISVNSVEGVEMIYKGKYLRGSLYEIASLIGADSVITTRDYAKHGPWRRIWWVLIRYC
jgi:hypothetical protein